MDAESSRNSDITILREHRLTTVERIVEMLQTQIKQLQRHKDYDVRLLRETARDLVYHLDVSIELSDQLTFPTKRKEFESYGKTD
jgi:hypothetical protein